MTQNYRLDNVGLINRDKKISFKFNGVTYFGYEGDTLASALLANGVHLIGRSFKYHRPRGFFGAGVDEPYAIVQLYRNNETEPNVKATEQELFEGLEATSVNCWPSVNFDIGAINNLLKIFLPAGFYYKTFMWPKSFWYKVYEPFIRKAAGLGVASIEHDKERYEHKYEYCDLLIAGSGPSGLASAYAAAKNGARVILAEDKPRFGGTLLTSEVNIGNQTGKEWAENIISELKEMPNVIVKNRSQVFGYYDHNMLVMSEKLSDHLPKTKKYNPKQRLWYIRAKEVLISSGSIERPLVFGNNDTPGVMLSSAAKEYLKVYGVLVGKKPLIFTNNDSGYETAIEFKKNGIDPIIGTEDLIYRDNKLILGDVSTIVIQNTTSSTNLTTGSFVAYGGVSINKELFIGDKLVVKDVDVTPNMEDISAEREFDAGNNVSIPTDVSGFVFTSTNTKSFSAMACVNINTVTDEFDALYEIRGLKKRSGWIIDYKYIGDDIGIDFSIRSDGQIQYISDNQPDWLSTKIKFRALTTTV